MKRLAIGVGAAVFLSLVGAVVNLEPASACSCIAATDQSAFERSDAVFVGRVVGYAPPPQDETWSSADLALWRFAVSQVYKGEVRSIQDVVSEVSGASCGLEIPKLGEFLVFATVPGTLGAGVPPVEGHLYAGLCGGTRATSTGLLAPELASARPPLPAPPLAPLVDADDDGASAIAPLGWLVVAIVGAAVAVAVLLVRRRRGRAA